MLLTGAAGVPLVSPPQKWHSVTIKEVIDEDSDEFEGVCYESTSSGSEEDKSGGEGEESTMEADDSTGSPEKISSAANVVYLLVLFASYIAD